MSLFSLQIAPAILLEAEVFRGFRGPSRALVFSGTHAAFPRMLMTGDCNNMTTIVSHLAHVCNGISEVEVDLEVGHGFQADGDDGDLQYRRCPKKKE